MKFKCIFYLLVMIPLLLISQNTIKATFTPEEDFTWGILYKNSPTGKKYVAQSKFVKGHIVFKLNEKATKGIYKLVYAVPQNEYNFDLIYNGKEDIELKFNLNDGAIFLKSAENILLFSYLSELTSLGKSLEAEFSKNQINRKAITTIFDTQRELQITYEEKSKGMLVNHFIKANKPYTPSKYEPKSSYIKNQTTDYFKNIDFSNEVLQSSNLLLDKSLAYVYSVVNEGFTDENNYSFNIDQVVAKTRFANPIFRKSFLEKMWQKFVSNDDIIVANYLAERYLIPLANQQNDTSLALKLIQFKNLSIGNSAPDFILDESSRKKLSTLDVAENYILVFWSSGCSHCLKELPQLHSLSQKLNSTKYKVVAVGLEENNTKWSSEIKNFPNFINAIKLQKWDNKVVKDYALTSTPTYFLLDQNKKFKFKPEGLKDLEAYLNKE
ncbi:MAG: TlpA family protein disulfide reductase [Flavobacteriales bacterium]|nr:MAG: TlpA family protein disulfide reductase [Flavobacteriales bacterium]